MQTLPAEPSSSSFSLIVFLYGNVFVWSYLFLFLVFAIEVISKKILVSEPKNNERLLLTVNSLEKENCGYKF